MNGAKSLCNGTGVRQLVEVGFLDADRERSDRRCGAFGGKGSDDARVHPATQEDTHGDVTPKPQSDRLTQDRQAFFDVASKCSGALWLILRRPVLLDPDHLSVPRQEARRG